VRSISAYPYARLYRPEPSPVSFSVDRVPLFLRRREPYPFPGREPEGEGRIGREERATNARVLEMVGKRGLLHLLVDEDGTERACIPDQNNFRETKYPYSEHLEEKIKAHLGTVRYTNAAACVRERKYVGVMRAEGDAVTKTVEGLVAAMIELHGGIERVTINANENGYKAVVRANKTILNIVYDQRADSVLVHQYRRRGGYSEAAVRRVVHLLRKEEPRVDINGYRNGTTTDDLGVLVYGTNPIVVGVKANRKKGLVVSKPYQRTTTTEAAREMIQKEFAYKLASSFPNAEEKTKIEQEKGINFTLRFRGYRHSDSGNPTRDIALTKSYQAGIQQGISGIFRNLERLYTRREDKGEEQPTSLTEDEWFTEVFMKAEAREEVIFRGQSDKNDPLFRMRLKGRKAKPGEIIPVVHTIAYPTAEGMQKAYESALAAKAARKEEEIAAAK
jgi:hypothetical protein